VGGVSELRFLATAGGRPRALSRLRQAVSEVLGEHPRLYYPIMQHHRRYRELLINNATDLVIEGYPRSGNTFAVAALQFVQPQTLHIARHTHSPAQVMEAVRLGLPTLVVVRNPRDAAVSLVIREPEVTLAHAFARYRRYHERIHACRAGFLVATFDEVTTEFGAVVERFNRTFGLSLTPFAHTQANCDAVFKIVEDMERKDFDGVLREHRVARPSEWRREPKARLAEAVGDASYRTLLGDCDRLYETFRALAAKPPTAGAPAAHRSGDGRQRGA